MTTPPTSPSAEARRIVFDRFFAWYNGDEAITIESLLLDIARRVDAHALQAISNVEKGRHSDARAGGLEKAVEIARYCANLPDRNAAFKAACREVEIYCAATAGRLRRGEHEDASTSVEGFEPLPIDSAPGGESKCCLCWGFDHPPCPIHPGATQALKAAMQPDLVPGLRWAIENCVHCVETHRIPCRYCAPARAKLKELGHG